MSCRIKRNNEGIIEEVTDKFGRPSSLFNDINSSLHEGAMPDIAYAAYLQATSKAEDIGLSEEPSLTSNLVSKVLTNVQDNLTEWSTASIELKSHEATTDLEDSLDYFLQKIGVKVRTVETLRDEKGNEVSAMGLADMTNRVVQLATGKADVSTLSEEASHFIVEILRSEDSPLFSSMYNLIENYKEYKEILNPEGFYFKKYDGNIDLLKREAIAKVISNHIVKGHTKNETKEKLSRLQRWWARVLKALSNMFRATQTDPFVESSMLMFRDNLEKAIGVDPRHSKISGTFYQDTTVEETLSLLKKFEGMYKTKEVDIKELESADLKKYFTRISSGEDTIERYVGVKGSPYEGRILKLRASDKGSELYKKGNLAKYMTEEKKAAFAADSEVRMKVGTAGHEVMEMMVDLVFKRKGSLSSILTGPGKVFSESHVKKMHKAMLNLKRTIDAQQAAINSSKKYTILPEQFISDEKSGLGGTIDLLVLYSDNSASIYDYKFKSASYKHSEYSKATKSLTIVGDMFSSSLDAYDSQLMTYRDTLLSKYGVTSLRQSRIIPVGLKYKKDREGRLMMGVEGLDIWTGSNQYDALEHIPVAQEKTRDESVNKLIEAEMRRYKKLAEEMKHTPFKDKEALEVRMATSIRITKALQLHLRVSPGLIEANRMVKRAQEGAGVHDQTITKDGEEVFNPKYLSDKELRELYNDLKHFRAFTELYQVRQDLKEDGTKRSKDLLQELDKSAGHIGTTIKLLESTILDRMDTKAKELGINNFRYNRNMPKVNAYINIESHSSPYSRYMNEIVKGMRGKALEFEKKLALEISTHEDNLASGSYSIQEAYLKLINPVTHNLHAKYSNKFYSEKDKAISEGDFKWMKQHYALDEEFYKKEFQNWKKEAFNRIEKSFPKAPDAARKAKLLWAEKYDVKNHDSAWVNAGGRYFTKINEDTTSKFITKEFKEISSTPELKAFYEFYTSKIREFEKRFGMNLGHTFIPNVKKSLVDSMMESSKPWETFMKTSVNVFKTREHDVEFAQYDTDGSNIRHIPRLHTAELKSEDEFGNEVTDRSLRSTELGRSLYLLGQAAIEYELKTEVEDELLLIEQLLKDGAIDTISEGAQGKAISQGFGLARTVFNASEKAAENFSDLVDQVLYNVQIKDKDMVSSGGVSATKTLLAFKKFHSIAALGLKAPVALGALGAGLLGVKTQGAKGIHITNKHIQEAEMAMLAKDPKVRAVMELFQTTILDVSKRRGELLASTVRAKYMTGDRWFEFLAQADAVVDTALTIAMAKNHGIGKDGELYRLQELPEGAKSLWDSMEVEENSSYKAGVTDRYTTSIEGLTPNAFNDFRSRVSVMSTKIKGSASPESVNTAGMKLINRFFLHYRSWLPGLALERFGKLRYDYTLKHYDQGTYKGFVGNFGKDEMFDDMGQLVTAEWVLHEYMGAIFADTAKVALDIATFGMTNTFKIKEGRARLEFEEFLQDNIGNPDFTFNTKEEKDASFEKFLELKRANIKGTLQELRTVTMLMLLMMMLGGDWDDDGKIDVRQSWAGRKLYNITSRIYREVAVFLDLTELTGARSSGIPLLSLGQDGIKWINNSFDELWDRVLGRQGVEKNDRVEAGYYSFKLAPGLGGLVKTLEIYPQHKQSKT